MLNLDLERLKTDIPERYPFIFLFFILLGVSALWSLFKALLKTITKKYLPKKILEYKEYGWGSWALVDTCDSEAAKNFSFELANNSFNLLLLVKKSDRKFEEKLREHVEGKNLKLSIHYVKLEHSESITLIKELLQKHDISLIISSCLEESTTTIDDDFNHLRLKIEEVFANIILTLRTALPYFKKRKQKSAFLLLKSNKGELDTSVKKKAETNLSIIDHAGDKFVLSLMQSANLEFGDKVDIKFL
jgi:hypothetical protein